MWEEGLISSPAGSSRSIPHGTPVYTYTYRYRVYSIYNEDYRYIRIPCWAQSMLPRVKYLKQRRVKRAFLTKKQRSITPNTYLFCSPLNFVLVQINQGRNQIGPKNPFHFVKFSEDGLFVSTLKTFRLFSLLYRNSASPVLYRT